MQTDGLIVTHQPGSVRLDGRWDLYLEDGSERGIKGDLGHDVPWGYHHLERTDRPEQADLIVCPKVCFWPDSLRTWGWATQLYALRSARSWGIGDLDDLAEVARWAAARGAGVVMTSPIHAPCPTPALQTSPYYPSSRCFGHPIYVSVERLASDVGLDPRALNFEALRRTGRSLNATPRIDYEAAWSTKLAAIAQIWTSADRRDDVERRVAARGDGGLLRDFGTFCALTEAQARSWKTWPSELRRPGSNAVDEFARDRADRVAFHCFVQLALEDQLADAARGGAGIVHDLAVGVAPDGFDAWRWQDAMLKGASVGAPPDDFNAEGQDWGVAAFDPKGLRREGYAPFVACLRAGFRSAQGLRIDHVMGLYRLFMVPAGASPDQGAYMTCNAPELLGILALESWRAQAWVVGEDLGTVGVDIREDLTRRGVASYKVAYFEDDGPRHYPQRALACAGTHDLPTLGGLWTGSDLADQDLAGAVPKVDGDAKMKERLVQNFDLAPSDPLSQVVRAVAAGLARSPAAVAMVSFEDALGTLHRHNMPGTVDTWPNWTQVLSLDLTAVLDDPGVAAICALMNAGRLG
ncbi:MAG: 4-alpha-glucanotransferase [Acidimicrobiales bacterium]